ncbi:MAG: hypothetical protein E6R08_06445 [Nevskiaceae bacterium]|nr:MAG: hypothetical protein E6R08_06445 [Nevskiaceae bacterium]
MASNDPQRQYIRAAQVIIGKAGKGISVEDLRIAFEVTKDHQSAPNEATIKIYNLNDDNQSRVRFEFEDVILNAGYQGGMRVLFRGNIKYVYRYREGTNWVVEIAAGDGDRDFRGAVINESFAAGATDAQILDRCVNSFSTTKKGAVKGLSAKARVRGKVVSGNTRTVLDDMARNSDCNWSIQDGAVQIVPANGVLDSEAILVNEYTGMVGTPQQDDKGIKVKMLLNPLLQINGRVKLDNDNIKRKKQKLQAKAAEESNTPYSDPQPARIDPDGIYKTYKIVHKGDTHSQNEWTSEAYTVSLDSPFPTKDAA